MYVSATIVLNSLAMLTHIVHLLYGISVYRRYILRAIARRSTSPMASPGASVITVGHCFRGVLSITSIDNTARVIALFTFHGLIATIFRVGRLIPPYHSIGDSTMEAITAAICAVLLF